MIPILYYSDESRFLTNGIGRLSDCISCIVTEERNGVYECEFKYPITGVHYSQIEEDNTLILASHDDTGDLQPFDIYGRSAPINGIVTFYAHHISYRLNKITVMPFTAGSCVDALSKIKTNSVNSNPFEFWTDKVTVADLVSDVPRQARGLLGGQEGSVLDVYGTGDYEFDKFTVKLHQDRGTDSGVEIRYGKNMTDVVNRIDSSEVYNSVVPYWKGTLGEDDVIVTLPEGVVVYSDVPSKVTNLTDHDSIILRTETNEPLEVAYRTIDTVPLDMSDAFEEAPTVAQLRQATTSRLERSEAWKADQNIEVDFVALWQTEQYKDYAPLQRVRLCDTVSVYYPELGINAVKQKVVKAEYNVLLDRYDRLELGQVQTSLGQTITTDIMSEVPTSSMMQSAIKYATDLIRGGLGGYVVMTPSADGYPQEILILDSPDINEAVNVWRFNRNGLGHSSNGYSGPYSDIALTADGRINANMITTGTLNADLIRAGVITDASGLNYWDLISGQFVTKQGSIAGLDIGADSISRITNDYYLYIDRKAIEFGSKPGNGLNGKTRLYGGGVRFMSSGTSWDNVVDSGSIWADSYGLFLSYTYYGGFQQFQIHEDHIDLGTSSVRVGGDFTVNGTKSRVVDTDNYSDRLLYAYETPTPLFGDIGEAVIDEDGFAYVDIDDIFSETIADKVEYQVFLQKEGEGDCWVSDKQRRYFVIQGTPNLKVAWELKAKQKDYQNIRLEQSESGLEEYKYVPVDTYFEDYINSQEDLLYG